MEGASPGSGLPEKYIYDGGGGGGGGGSPKV